VGGNVWLCQKQILKLCWLVATDWPGSIEFIIDADPNNIKRSPVEGGGDRAKCADVTFGSKADH